MYLFLWIFFVYSFLGWCTEVSYAALVTGKFVNRGFLNGPVCPVYGFGVVIVLSILVPLKGNLLVLFIGSVILTSLLEWLTGFLLEKIFHQRWWDYSDQPFNIGGYICLRFSIAWGFACLIVVDAIHPTVFWLITSIPHGIGVVILGILAVIMAVDLIATVRTITNMNQQLQEIDELARKIKGMSNEFGEQLADKVLDAAEKGTELRSGLTEELEDLRDTIEKIREKLSQRQEQRQNELDELKERLNEVMNRKIMGQRRILKAYPKLDSLPHRQALRRVRRWLNRS